VGLDDMIISAFCIIDDALTSIGGRIRRAGPTPTVSDAEVITMEVIGEFLGLDHDNHLMEFFRGQYGHFFPGIRRIHRTTFVRQAANLWRVKEQVWRRVLDLMSFEGGFAMVDSIPMPVCRFARAYRCRLFRPEAAFGKDHVERQTFFGFRLHARVCWPGVVTEFAIEPANTAEPEVALSLAAGTTGTLVGDRGYSAAWLQEALARRRVKLIAPHKSKKNDPFPRLSRTIARIRYRIECTLAQLVGRFQVKRVRTRDLWHLASRVMRKVLSHTLMILLNQKAGNSPSIRLSALLA